MQRNLTTDSLQSFRLRHELDAHITYIKKLHTDPRYKICNLIDVKFNVEQFISMQLGSIANSYINAILYIRTRVLVLNYVT